MRRTLVKYRSGWYEAETGVVRRKKKKQGLERRLKKAAERGMRRVKGIDELGSLRERALDRHRP
jgi:hypothetical protein